MADAKGGGAYAAGQLPLRFPAPDPTSEPLITTGPYETVRRMLDRWANWPEGQLALIGPEGSGKTRLALQWACEVGAAFIDGPDLSSADISQVSSLSVKALVIDDADKIKTGANLLAALNLTRQRRAPIMLTGSSEPSAWPLDPPDLRSRLGAMPVMRIGPLDDDAFKQRLTAACKARFMKLPEETARYLLERMDRSHALIDLMAVALEEAANGKALTKASAKKALELSSADPAGGAPRPDE